jgi:hypothetical protein
MCKRSETASKGYDVVRWRGIPLRDCLQQVEKYDNSSGVCNEEDKEEEDGARLVSAHYARAAADVLQTDVLSALMLHLRPPFCLLRVCLSQMTHGQLFEFGLGPIL